jgi:hypothetical protein
MRKGPAYRIIPLNLHILPVKRVRTHRKPPAYKFSPAKGCPAYQNSAVYRFPAQPMQSFFRRPNAAGLSRLDDNTASTILLQRSPPMQRSEIVGVSHSGKP